MDHRGHPSACFSDIQGDDTAQLNRSFVAGLLLASGDKALAWVIYPSTDIGEFINPLQQRTAN